MDRSPELGRESFNCPHCHAFCQQAWFELFASAATGPLTTVTEVSVEAGLASMKSEGTDENIIKFFEPLVDAVKNGLPGMLKREKSDQHWPERKLWNAHISQCFVCRRESIWLGDNVIYPDRLVDVPLPNEDLPPGITEDYLEAAKVAAISPRAAAALLRLCIQKLCAHVLGKPGDINAMIGQLVKDGLSSRVQKALDTVRVIGNEAVHPGTMDLRDDRDTALKLFRIVNLISDAMISQPKHIDDLYAGLPPAKREGIDHRDKRK